MIYLNKPAIVCNKSLNDWLCVVVFYASDTLIKYLSASAYSLTGSH